MATDAKAAQMVERLRHRYEIGQEANLTQLSIEEFAAKEGLSSHTVRKLKRFANAYSPEDLNEFCQLRRPNGLPLHFGYVNYLLVVADKVERQKLQQRLAREGWSATELAGRLPRKFRGASPHGRPMKKPATLAAGLEKAAEEAIRLTRRVQVVRDVVDGRPGPKLRERAEEMLTAVTALRRELRSLEKELRDLAAQR